MTSDNETIQYFRICVYQWKHVTNWHYDNDLLRIAKYLGIEQRFSTIFLVVNWYQNPLKTPNNFAIGSSII
jgi:hypothetical protein